MFCVNWIQFKSVPFDISIGEWNAKWSHLKISAHDDALLTIDEKKRN